MKIFRNPDRKGFIHFLLYFNHHIIHYNKIESASMFRMFSYSVSRKLVFFHTHFKFKNKLYLQNLRLRDLKKFLSIYWIVPFYLHLWSFFLYQVYTCIVHVHIQGDIAGIYNFWLIKNPNLAFYKWNFEKKEILTFK